MGAMTLASTLRPVRRRPLTFLSVTVAAGALLAGLSSLFTHEARFRIRSETPLSVLERDDDDPRVTAEAGVITVRQVGISRDQTTRDAGALARLIADTIFEQSTREHLAISERLRKEQDAAAAELAALPPPSVPAPSDLEALEHRRALTQDRLSAYRAAEEEARSRAAEIGPLVGQPEFDFPIAAGEMPRTEEMLQHLDRLDVALRQPAPDPSLREERRALLERLDPVRDEELQHLRRRRREAMVRELKHLALDEERARRRQFELAEELVRLQAAVAEASGRSVPVDPHAARRVQLAAAVRRLSEERGRLTPPVPPAVEFAGESTPHPLAFAGVAMAALLAGILAAALVEAFSSTIRSEGDLRRAVNLPIFGAIPRVLSPARRLLIRQGPATPLAETFTTIGTLVETYAVENEAQVFMIAGPQPRDGKSTLAANLAIALARGRRRVVLIDADLRRPSLHRFFDLESAPGLGDYLAAAVDARLPGCAAGQIARKTAVDGLQVIPAGTLPDHPSMLLKLEAMDRLLEELRQSAELILIDTSPVTASADALVLASRADAVLLAVSSGRTRRQAASAARRLIESAGGRLVGCLLNRAPASATAYLGYGAEYRREPSAEA